MPDYNIYIRSMNGDGDNKKTNPNKTEPNNTSVSDEDEDKQNLMSILKQGSNFLGSAKGAVVGAIKAAAPVVAVVAAAKIADRVISTIEPFVTQATGDYHFNTVYNNVKQTLGIVTHPLSTTMGYLHYQQSIELAQKRNEQSKILLGDTAIGSVEGENV